jgi:F0F1-type ATP synthase membrane subunit c/vacuolar-type H+-ATPase subunit K
MTGADFAAAGIVAGLGLVAVLLGMPLVSLMMTLIDRSQTRYRDLPGWDPEPDSVSASARGLGGGAWIGMLERLAIFATLVAGFPAGMAVVLGIKGLARYPELQNPDLHAAQGFIVGTFLSVLFASGCAGLALWLVGLL